MININAKSDDLMGYGNKVYYSHLDKNIALISPNDNNTLCLYANYDVYLYSSTQKNYTIYLNNTFVCNKSGNVLVILSSFYVNSTVFTLYVKDIRNITYIEIHYIAVGGYIPINDKNYPIYQHWKDQFKIPLPDRMLVSDFVNAGIILLVLSLFAIFLIGLKVYNKKSHNVVEDEYMDRDDYYNYNPKSKGE